MSGILDKPLQTIKTNLFWSQEVENYMEVIKLQQVQKCIQLLKIDGHRYPIWKWVEQVMAAVRLQIMSM